MTAQRIAIATVIAGVLDIASAFTFAGMSGASPAQVLATIASGPFGPGVLQAAWAPAAGLAIHFALIAAMVSVYHQLAARRPLLAARIGPLLGGIAYGLALYIVMYWIVLPLRWPGIHPLTDFSEIAKAVFAHVVCVGLPIAFVMGARSTAADVAKA